jgi:hypothetical protein
MLKRHFWHEGTRLVSFKMGAALSHYAVPSRMWEACVSHMDS